MKIECNSWVPDEPHVLVTVDFPDWIAQIKPDETVQECFIEKVRHIFVKLSSCKQEREEQGENVYQCVEKGVEKVVVFDIRSKAGLDLIMGFMLASWRFVAYRSCCKAGPDRVVVVAEFAEHTTHLEEMKAVVEGVHFARSLTQEPANILYPMAYAERLLALDKLGIEVEILDEAYLQKIGMTALLAVGQASPHPACVAVLSWRGSGGQPIALVGKGVCFDSGGLCLKPAKQQIEMKWDKAGAGAVVGTMVALAKSNSPVSVVGIVGLVENMPDGKAMKPGDVIQTMSGKTIEIVDTDAEGRLVLADCLHYAQERFLPKILIDLGTLTQETFATLGNEYAGLYSSDPDLIRSLVEAGQASGDKLWHLPMGSYFQKQLESPIADLKNLGIEYCGENGAAAQFLQAFVKTPHWAHIDIAGVAWTKTSPTGFGVRLLFEWLGYMCNRRSN